MIEIFIFDEIWPEMVGKEASKELASKGVKLNEINSKIKISEYPGIREIGSKKILCINPDFVNWSLENSELDLIPDVLCIVSSSDNTSWIDTNYTSEKGIIIKPISDLKREYSAVAEYVMMMLLNLARRIPVLIKSGFPLDYANDYIKYQGLDISGKKAGIIGLGNTGKAIAKLCEGLGMDVVYWSRTKDEECGYQYLEIENLIEQSDFIIPALKPNDQTRALMSNDRFTKLKKDAIVATAVSDLIDTSYFVNLVNNEKLFGFGFCTDPQSFNIYKGNVWAAPDYAWATNLNMKDSYSKFINKIEEALLTIN